MAGLLPAIPDLVALDLPALAAAAGYPGTRVIPAASWLLSLLALKLTATRRVSHVDDLLTGDPGSNRGKSNEPTADLGLFEFLGRPTISVATVRTGSCASVEVVGVGDSVLL
jgi:hypothetical protein